MVKQLLMQDLIVTRYSKTMTAIKLKDNDELVSVNFSKDNTVIITNNGYYLTYETKEIPVVGPKASGVKGIKLTDDTVVFGGCFNNEDEYLNIFTNNFTAKRVKLSDLKPISRAKKGNQILKKTKTVTYLVEYAYITNSKDIILIKSDSEIKEVKNSEISIMDVTSTGSSIGKGHVDKIDLKTDLVKIEYKEEKKEEIKSKVEKQVSFEDFTKDFKI